MDQREISINGQLSLAAELISFCGKCRQDSRNQKKELSALHGRLNSRLAEVESAAQMNRAREVQQLEDRLQGDLENLELDFRSRRSTLSANHEAASRTIEGELAATIEEVEEKRKSELWMLQSVMDEDGTDTPVAHFEREVETFHTQRSFLAERFDVLNQQVSASADYLAACHAAADRNLPEISLPRKKRVELRDYAVEQGDAALKEAQALLNLHLPHWVRGARPWAFGLMIFLVLLPCIASIRVDLRDYLNSDIGNPDWEWLGVSALIALSVVVLKSFILIFLAQNRLRKHFDRILQHVASAEEARRIWEDRSEKYLGKLEEAAEKWRTEVDQHRKTQAEKINRDLDARIATHRQESDAQLHQLAQELNGQLEQLDTECTATSGQLSVAARTAVQQQTEELDARLEQDRTALLVEYERASSELKAGINKALGDWNTAIRRLRELAGSAGSLAAPVARWPQPESGWKLPDSMPDCVPAGDVLMTVPRPPQQHNAEADSSLCLEMPAILQFPRDMALVVEHDAAGRESAISFLRTQVLRLLTTIPAGRVRLTLIDPVGLGQSFSAVMHLADFDEHLIQNRIWTDSSQIRDQLQKITVHMESIFQTYLRSQFDSIEEYNVHAGEVAEPYHFVVVAGFPTAFTDESARHLSSILTSGPKCGVHALVAWNPAIGAPPGFDPEELRSNCLQFRVVNGTVQPAAGPGSQRAVIYEATTEPKAEDYVSLVREVGEQSKDARRVEVSFNRISPHQSEVWTKSTSGGIDLPIGRAGAARLQFLRLGRGTSQHVLVAGKTGSGKSTFLHILITNLALHYGPDEIQFYLIDFKKGVEFRTYAANRLPHARVVAIESDREFGLSVLERLDEVLQERGDLFRERGIQDVPSFRQQFPGEPMPRLLLLIDEFQEFFVAEDRVSARASLLLDRLVRQGRAFGIHVMLGSQTLGGAYSLARSTMGQIAVRIALQCSENDAHLILSEDNSAARLLTRPGEAIYNDENGLTHGNSQFQIAWLDEAQREQLIGSMPERENNPAASDAGMIVFEGNVPPTAELCGPLNAFLKTPQDATRRSADATTIWLGEPVAIAAPTCVEMRRASGQNLLIVGQDELQVDSLLAYAVLSFSLQPMAKDDVRAAKLTLLHDGRDQESLKRFTGLQARLGETRLPLHKPGEVDGVVASAYQDLLRREESAEASAEPEHLLIIRNIGQYRSLRKEDDDFGLGGFGEPKELTTASMFSELLKRGPLVGIHLLVWSDTFNNAVRWMSNALMREYENRVAFRMNQTDSASLVDSPVAASLVPGRALLYRDQTGTTDKFRPFAWPSEEWLDSIIPSETTGSTDGMDIDTLTIE